MKVLVLDNYDSFTFNLVHYIEQIMGVKPAVLRNNQADIASISGYDKICISPGPGLPVDAGITIDLIRTCHERKSILGVCLGHQAIAEAFGNTLVNMPQVLHGVARQTTVTQTDYLFKDLPVHFMSGRYHSWAVQEVREPLQAIATDRGGYIMALRHKEYDIRGVQFHPESILTEHGLTLIKNWLEHAN